MSLDAKLQGAKALLAAYNPPSGAVDELLDAEGRIRPHWQPVLAALAEKDDLPSRFAAADRHLRKSGASYRVYERGESFERPWPLSHMPLVVSPSDWAVIEAGIKQRAELLQKVLADLYGPAELVKSGALPAAAVAGNPGFLRPMVGAPPRGGDHLLVYAADLGRGPDGGWWVLGDRAQAPSGMGYALENRLAISQALPTLFGSLHVERLAPFFQILRDMLARRANRDRARIGLLTPGPANETYFEHAYLARYLGLLLVEGGDLTAQGNMVYVRTVEGLKRIDGLLRRLDGDFADPLELNAWSRLGVPGLAEAARAGAVAMANALGAGLIEARAMLAFLPALARRLLGSDLLLPNVATWWCGEDSARRHAAANLRHLSFDPAFPRRVEGLNQAGSTVIDPCDPRAAERMALLLDQHGAAMVAQERVSVSTMPVWTGEGLEPRPFTLRVFAVAAADGWQVMPGGLCRVADDRDPRKPLSMQRGGRSADVWVMVDRPVESAGLLQRPDAVAIRRRLGQLSSRAADNLFWLGRYLERAEATLRVVRALAELSSDMAAQSRVAPARLASLLSQWGAVEGKMGDGLSIEQGIEQALRGDAASAVPSLVASAGRAASVIRERLSPDAARVLADLRFLADSNDGAPAERADRSLRALAALSGLMQENMNRIAGWRFLQTGRRIERGALTCALVRELATPRAEEDELDALLQTTDSQITYRSRYLMGALHRPVLDLIVLDDANPRSILFQVEQLAEHFDALPGSLEAGRLDPHQRTLRLLKVRLETSAAEDVDDALMEALERQFFALSDEVAARFFGQGETQGDVEGLG